MPLTIAAAESVPVAYAPGWAPATITARGTAVLRALELADLVRRLDRADRDYLAPYVADVLVDCATDIPPSR